MEGILGRLLSFDKMIAGLVIKILYYVGLVVILALGVWRFFGSLFSGDVGAALIALIGIPIGILVLRVVCELYIVIFRISDNLAALRKMKEEEKNISAS